STSLLRYTCHAAARGGGGGRRDCVQVEVHVAVEVVERVKQRENLRWKHILQNEGKKIQLLLNAGGPYRLLHVQMAEAVAQFRGYGTSKIKSVSASS
ncbi:hypothetical protein S83_036182, partial [Arachis hypogaea]